MKSLCFASIKRTLAIFFSLGLLAAVLISMNACQQEDNRLTVDTYTVKLDFDYLSQVEEQQIPAGGLVTPPDYVPEVSGYDNVGWFVQDGESWRQWDMEHDTVHADTVLIYRREAKSYEWTLVMNDGTDATERVQMTIGAPYELPTPQREGYEFMGWYLGWTKKEERGIWQTSGTGWYTARWAAVPVGTTITLGTYEQDGDVKTGKEPIEWIVVDRNSDGTGYLVISKYILDWVPIHSSTSYVAYSERSLRAWLADTFYPTAFTQEERERILLTQLSDVVSQDYVFLPSETEIRMFTSPDEPAGVVTAYAENRLPEKVSHKGKINGYQSLPYWLRYDEGFKKDYVASIGSSGTKESGTAGSGLRPAMWVDAAYVDALLAQQ